MKFSFSFNFPVEDKHTCRLATKPASNKHVGAAAARPRGGKYVYLGDSFCTAFFVVCKCVKCKCMCKCKCLSVNVKKICFYLGDSFCTAFLGPVTVDTRILILPIIPGQWGQKMEWSFCLTIPPFIWVLLVNNYKIYIFKILKFQMVVVVQLDNTFDSKNVFGCNTFRHMIIALVML